MTAKLIEVMYGRSTKIDERSVNGHQKRSTCINYIELKLSYKSVVDGQLRVVKDNMKR